jgi:hypothetical protein
MDKPSVTQSIFATAVICFISSGVALADTPLGLYVAGSVGQADVRTSLADFSARHFGWDVSLGIRPLPLLGAELEYVNFGRPTVHSPENPLDAYYLSTTADARQRATELSMLGLVPLRPQWFNLYGRAGIARLQTNAHAQTVVVCPSGPCSNIVFAPVSLVRTDTRFLYGIGAQAKFHAFAARLEYQRLGTNGEDPDLLSAGLVWKF